MLCFCKYLFDNFYFVFDTEFYLYSSFLVNIAENHFHKMSVKSFSCVRKILIYNSYFNVLFIEGYCWVFYCICIILIKLLLVLGQYGNFSSMYLQSYRNQSPNSRCESTDGFYISFKSTETFFLTGTFSRQTRLEHRLKVY